MVFDIITIAGIWAISLCVAEISILQTKGADWYTPISKKQKMNMTILNASLLFFIILFMNGLKFVSSSKTYLVSVVCIVLIIFLNRKAIWSFFKKLFGKQTLKDQMNDAAATESDAQSDDEETPQKQNTLGDMFQRFLTVFNICFTVLNIGYMGYIYYHLLRLRYPNGYSVVLSMDSSLPISITLLFWSTLVGLIMTAKEWAYTDLANRIEYKKRNISIAQRIMDRNRR